MKTLKRVLISAPVPTTGDLEPLGYWEAEIDWDNGEIQRITGINVFSIFSQIDSMLERIERIG